MSLYSYIKEIDDPPSWLMKSDTRVEITEEEQVPLKLYQCPVCRCRFIYFTCFIKTCSSHFPEVRSFLPDLETDERPIKVEIDYDQTPNGSSEEQFTDTSNESEDEKFDLQNTTKKRKKTDLSHTSLDQKNSILCCPICKKTFMRRQIYRDHMDAHENPLIKCCQICVTEFSSGINANKHKKKFHPELYEQELKERAIERAKDGRRRNRLQPIIIPMDKDNSRNCTTKSEIHPLLVPYKYFSYLKNIKVVLQKIYLPGFLRNEWIYLPKKGEDYPWIVEPQNKVKKEIQANDNVGQANYRTNTDLLEHEQFKKDVSQSQKEDDHEVSSKELNENKQFDLLKRNTYFIQQEEIPHVPQFQGSKYIFGVYGERRYKKIKENDKIKERKKAKVRNIASDEDNDQVNCEVSDAPYKDFLRPVKSYYKNEFKVCKICGVTRSNSNIRRHIAKHCVEEDDTECRIPGCEASFSVNNKLREHYSRVHKIKFREYLYNMQKEICEKFQDKDIGSEEDIKNKGYTCDICYTNMKNADDLRYHVEMLHCYKEGGGKSKGSLDCNVCGKTFAAVQNRNLHIRRIHKQILDGSVFCHYCGKDFMGKGFLLSHFRYAHFDKNGIFKEKSTVIKKRYKHPPKEAKTEDIAQHYQKYKVHSVCEICGLIKESRFAMMRHRYEKHGVIDPGYSKIIDRDREENDCKFCGKHFTSLRKWKDHEKYHLKEIPNLHCQVCGAKCKTETYLKAHMERHGEKKFYCDYEGCGKSFAVKHDVKIHKRRAHCDDLDYVCKICGTAFRTWNYRRYHEETVHGLVKIKQQRNKRRPLPQVAAVLQQQQEQQNEEISENVTRLLLPEQSTDSHTLNQQNAQTGNMSLEQFNTYQITEERDCQYCGKHFDDYRKWQNHEYYHKKINPDLACEICGAKCKTEYYLKAHMERHGEVKYFCQYPGCGKGFSVKHDVKIHQRRAHKDLVQDGTMQNSSIFHETPGSIPVVVLPPPTLLYPYEQSIQQK